MFPCHRSADEDRVGALLHRTLGVAFSTVLAAALLLAPGGDAPASAVSELAGTTDVTSTVDPTPPDTSTTAVDRVGSWPGTVAGAFAVTSGLRIPSGLAGTYSLRVGTQEPVTSDVPAGGCVDGCTVSSGLRTTPIPAGVSGSGPRSETVSGRLTLSDGTFRTHFWSIKVPVPSPPLTYLVTGVGEKRAFSGAGIGFDGPTVLRVRASEADSFTVRVSHGADTELFVRSVAAVGPTGARYADVVLDPRELTDPATGRQGAVVRTAAVVDGSHSWSGYLGVTHRPVSTTWTAPSQPVGPQRVGAAPFADVTATGFFNPWVEGLRVVVTETRVHQGTTTRKAPVEAVSYPYHYNVDRSGPNVVSAHLAPDPTKAFGPSFYVTDQPGLYTYSWQLQGDDGLPIGDPFVTRLDVARPTVAITAPPLAVGRETTVTAAGEYPFGTLGSCLLELEDVTGLVGRWGFCPDAATLPPSPRRTRTFTMTPQTAGSHHWIAYMASNPKDGHDSTARQAVTVHAERLATIAVPDVTVGAKGAASVTIKDRRDVGSVTVGVAQAPVTVQRRPVGTQAWSTYSRHTSGPKGVVSVPFTASATPMQWRVITNNGAGNWYSPVDGSRALARVGWTAAPGSATKGRSTTYTVAVSPAERGSSVHLQVKAPGAPSWVTASTKVVPTTSSSATASFSTSFSRAGVWQVRVLRPATTTVGQGLSTVKAVTVR